MLDEQKSGKLTDKHRCLTGEAFYGEECLILLRGYARVLGLHIAEGKEESQPVTKLGKGFVIDGIKRISLASFAALRSMRPPSFSLFKPNHRCSLMLSISPGSRRNLTAKANRDFQAGDGATIPACSKMKIIRSVNVSIVGLSSEELPEFEYSCGASSSPALLRLQSSRFHPLKISKWYHATLRIANCRCGADAGELFLSFPPT